MLVVKMSSHCSAIFTLSHLRLFFQIVERSWQCPIYLILKQIPILGRKFHLKVIALFHRLFRQPGITSSAVPTWAQPQPNTASFKSTQDRKAGFGATTIFLNNSKNQTRHKKLQEIWLCKCKHMFSAFVFLLILF